MKTLEEQLAKESFKNGLWKGIIIGLITGWLITITLLFIGYNNLN